jgi:hypothetical protein
VFSDLAPCGSELPPEQWGVAEVRTFVHKAGLGQYAETVATNCVNGGRLLALRVDQLGQLGVRDFAHQKLLIDRIRSVRRSLALLVHGAY